MWGLGASLQCKDGFERVWCRVSTYWYLRTGISPNSPIWHDGLTIDVAIKPSILNVSSGQVSSSQVAIAQLNFKEINSNQASISQVAASNSSASEFSAIQNRPFQDAFFQPTEDDTRVAQIGFTEINLVKINLSQVGISEISSTQIGSGRINEIQPILIPGEISISSSIEFPQVFVSNSSFSFTTVETHTAFPTFIYDIKNTALTLWNTYLQPTAPLNLTIKVTDLPTGQLAEAQITGFDPTGRPNSSTLYLGHRRQRPRLVPRPRPLGQHRIRPNLTDTAYRATADSLAYGHYGLLTTLLHETAHLQGILSGYSNYDRHIQTINGSKTLGLSEVDALPLSATASAPSSPPKPCHTNRSSSFPTAPSPNIPLITVRISLILLHSAPQPPQVWGENAKF
jgi:hypothetical protein